VRLSRVKYALHNTKTKLRKLLAAAEPHWARLYGRFAPPLEPARIAPVLVLGNQKTGSSAIAHLLAARGGLSLAANVHPAQGRERRMARLDASEMRAFIQNEARYYFGHAVVKENALTSAVGALLEALPNARGIFIVRHPAHNIRSILDRLGLPGTPQPLGTVAADLPAGWRDVVTNGGLRSDDDDDDAPEDHITALARRWATLARRYLRHAERLHLARYEDFMADKAGFVRRLADTLDIPFQRDIESLLDVPFQPRGAHRGAALDQFFSTDALRIIDDCCASEMRALRYDRVSANTTLPDKPAS
jgi:hypothetical protein